MKLHLEFLTNIAFAFLVLKSNGIRPFFEELKEVLQPKNLETKCADKNWSWSLFYEL